MSFSGIEGNTPGKKGARNVSSNIDRRDKTAITFVKE
jgi:hypothetical protein